ncbi:MAG: serine hydrolase [Desulfobacteraceae bacterium]|nr:serine hydrolase [Desulfobacteraceae bacterium]
MEDSYVSAMKVGKLREAAEYAQGSGIIMRGGKTVYQWGDIDKLHDLKSISKSIGISALGLALDDGLVELDDKAIKHFPDFDKRKENNGLNKAGEITLFHLATHTAGFDKPGGDPPLLFMPGSSWAYSDGGPNWLADILTCKYQKDLKEVMFERVFSRIGITRNDLTWRENAYRDEELNGVMRREFGSGIHANARAMAKIGQLYLNKGSWNGEQILPEYFVEAVRKSYPQVAALPVKNDPKNHYANASRHYGLLWWNNQDGSMKNVPEDAFWAWGLYDSIIAVIPSLDLVIVRAGDSFKDSRSPSYYEVLEPFFEDIVSSVNHGAPYPDSPVVSNVIWAPPESIVRRGEGSDNWPLTWADDGNLYMAYGDGWGFEPKTEKKLSLGFAVVKGDPDNFEGENIRSRDEQYGEEDSGKKASGMLMADNVLYMWVRNADGRGKQSQLAWSKDHGRNWTWEDWKFKKFGYLTFINFGKNYAGARDNYIYTVTHDNPSAYQRADRFVLMRVPKEKIKNKEAYEFFRELDSKGNPVWTGDIAKRGAVFKDTGRCLRSGVSYNEGLDRYFWWQAKYSEQEDGRYAGSFGAFDAPEPWGPWTTVYYTRSWDVGAGETGSFPSKWMSGDGKTMHLVFSGDDAFSVRKCSLVVR